MGQIFPWVIFPIGPALLPYNSVNVFSTSGDVTPQTAHLVCPFQVSVDPSMVIDGDPPAPSLPFLAFHILFSPPPSYKAVESKYTFSFPSWPGEEGSRFFLPHFPVVGGWRRSDEQVSALFPGLRQREKPQHSPLSSG